MHPVLHVEELRGDALCGGVRVARFDSARAGGGWSSRQGGVRRARAATCAPFTSRSKSEVVSPARPAASERTVGGSCLWSPTSTMRRASCWSATAVESSHACVASSMMIVSKNGARVVASETEEGAAVA